MISCVSYKIVFLYGFYRIQRIKLGRTDNPLNPFKSVALLNYYVSGRPFLPQAFSYSKVLESFSLSEEASLFRGIGAMKRAMQMEELALTNA